jgi:hypothetical protein
MTQALARFVRQSLINKLLGAALSLLVCQQI